MSQVLFEAPGVRQAKRLATVSVSRNLAFWGTMNQPLNKQVMISESGRGGKFSFSKDTEVLRNETLYIKTKSHTER